MLHLIMARYQMLGMHPQNAAKYAEYVTQKLPDNREGWLLLANGYQNRGWYKKAVPAFERAYELGCRDPGFLLERITNIAQNGNTDEAEALFKQYAVSTPCNDDTRIMILECFQRWSEIITPTPGRISEFLHMFDRFLRKEAKKIDQMMFMSPLTELANHRKDVITDKTNRQRISQSIQALADRNMIPGRHAAILISDMLHWSVLLNPADLQPSWADLSRTLSQAMENDPGLRRYVETDALLCLASDPERTKAEIPLIRAEYPELAESYASYLEAIEKDETDQLLKKLKWEFEKMSSNYEGSRYEDLYGRTESNRAERRNKREKWDSFVDGFVEEPEEPFVREKDKVGRNDPCPCGSGKKFKKCCMGKGIYD
jgi:tetratricopeptide (TPR) repeat protein